ncbi:hypothetical protein PAPYR_5348 [Paratrimastix pyriformis]|uniref:Uncharacterized protein n=1 Tax=Paratrimastix pyriformis TaxID=342808 RepID=A0ABQ8UMW7_9EUKA|nr:hypothetical protein PAPYR_5348 [Paratrimastix pyriformis]
MRRISSSGGACREPGVGGSSSASENQAPAMEEAFPLVPSLEQLPDDLLLTIINEVITPLERREKLAINLGGFFALYGSSSRLHQLTALFLDMVKERKDAWLDFSVNSLFRVATCFNDICLNDTGITNSCLDFLAHKVPGLRSLSLRRCTKLTAACMASLHLFEHLEHLDITDCRMTRVAILGGSRSLPGLQKLTSLSCSGNGFLWNVIPPRLRHLEASGLVDATLTRLPCRMRSLSLRNWSGCESELDRFSGLMSLWLDRSYGPVAAAMLQKINPDLRVLHATFTRGHEARPFPWARFQQLEDLDLCETTFRTPVSLAHPSVRRLGLTLTPITRDMLQSALACCPRLARLDWHTIPGDASVPPPALPDFLRACDPIGLTSFTLDLHAIAMDQAHLDVLMERNPFRNAPHLLRLRMVGPPSPLNLLEETLRLLAAACPRLEALVTENLGLSPAGLCAACGGWPRLRTLVTQSGTPDDPFDLTAAGVQLPGLRTLALRRSFVRPENLCGFLRGAAALRHLALDQCRCPGYADGVPAPTLVSDSTLDLLACSRLQTLALGDSFGAGVRPPAASASPASCTPVPSPSPQVAPLSPLPSTPEPGAPLPPFTPEGFAAPVSDPLTEQGWCSLICRGLMLRALWIRGCSCFGRAALETLKTHHGPHLRTVGIRNIAVKGEEASDTLRGAPFVLRHSEPTPNERWISEVESDQTDQLALLWQSKSRKWLDTCKLSTPTSSIHFQ